MQQTDFIMNAEFKCAGDFRTYRMEVNNRTGTMQITCAVPHGNGFQYFAAIEKMHPTGIDICVPVMGTTVHVFIPFSKMLSV